MANLNAPSLPKLHVAAPPAYLETANCEPIHIGGTQYGHHLLLKRQLAVQCPGPRAKAHWLANSGKPIET
ncbi:hypothetical protein [Bradyrhizobium sp. USDA 223]|uniref:hypothetical protein n=1 Tax=Bradyrhizobium sp. USDA 223 TaxID=3156306 RepID=UPI0038381D87